MNQIAPGDVVRRKKGYMVVATVTDGQCECHWIDPSGIPHEEVIASCDLDLVKRTPTDETIAVGDTVRLKSG